MPPTPNGHLQPRAVHIRDSPPRTCGAPERSGCKGVVVSVTDGPHGRPHAGFLAAVAEGKRGILPRFNWWPEWWITSFGRRWPSAMSRASKISSVRRWFAIDQPEPALGRAKPGPWDAAAEGVQHDGEVQDPTRCRQVGDIRDPELIGRLSPEVALDEVGRGPRRAASSAGLLCADRRRQGRPCASARRRACARAAHPGSAAQHEHAARRKSAARRRGCPAPARAAPRRPFVERTGLARAMHRTQPSMRRARAPTGSTAGSSPAAKGRPVASYDRHREDGPACRCATVRAHELEEPDGTAPVCRANQAGGPPPPAGGGGGRGGGPPPGPRPGGRPACPPGARHCGSWRPPAAAGFPIP